MHVPNRAGLGCFAICVGFFEELFAQKFSTVKRSVSFAPRAESRWPTNKCCVAGRSSLGVQFRCEKNSHRTVCIYLLSALFYLCTVYGGEQTGQRDEGVSFTQGCCLSLQSCHDRTPSMHAHINHDNQPGAPHKCQVAVWTRV